MGKDMFDERQKEAVNVLDNVVVSAGAGSGKTSVLSARFVNLVINQGYKVDEILTLTFTKKASVEMKGRIFQKLKEASENGETEEIKKRAMTAVQSFDKSFIGTLDSYCSNVARAGSHFYGISPDFSCDSVGFEGQVRLKALQYVLEHRDEPVIKYLASEKGLQAVGEDLFAKTINENSFVCEPVDFASGLAKQKEAVVEKYNLMADKINSNVTEIQRILREEDCGGQKIEQNFRNGFGELKVEIQKISMETFSQDFIDSQIPVLKQFQPGSKIRQPGTKTKYSGVLMLNDVLTVYKENFSTLLVYLNFIANYPLMENAVKLLTEFQEEILEEKRASGNFSFGDISYLARRILLEHPEIRRQEKNKYKAIMIDEFQDDNQLQCDLLFLLSEKDGIEEKEIATFENMKEKLNTQKLFFVGDEKQSIYRFRGADVSVFRNLKDNIQKNINLETNYRSCPELIEFFNTLFGGTEFPVVKGEGKKAESIMPVSGEEYSNYEAVYEKVLVPAAKVKTIKNPAATIAFFDKKKVASEFPVSEYQNEAFWIASEINRIIAEETYTDYKGQVCKYTYDDFAILFRTFTHMNDFVRVFLANGIPYVTDTFKSLFSDGPVNDIYSYLTICAYNNDSLSYAKVLTSPLVNLSVSSMEKVLSVSPVFFDLGAAEVLEAEEKENYLYAAENFVKFREEVKTQRLTKIISRIWYEYGYNYETVWNTKVQMFQNYYDLLFEFARQCDENSMNLASFVDLLKVYQNNLEKMDGIEAPFENVGGVKLMSIHGSKGLQFPVVFVCGTSNKGGNETNGDMVYVTKNYGVTFNLPGNKKITEEIDKLTSKNNFYDESKQLNNSQNEAELRRLMYVAYTRAINKLYITGTIDGKLEEAKNGCTKQIHVLTPVIRQYLIEEPDSAFEGCVAFKTTDNSPFDYVDIPEYSREQVFNYQNPQELPNTFKGKLEFIHRKQQEFADAEEAGTIIKKEKVIGKYVNPSALEEERTITSSSGTIPFEEVNAIVESVANNRFGFNDFGIIVHKFIECMIKGEQLQLNQKYIAALDNNEEKIQTVIDAAGKMAEGFINSDLGKQALWAKKNGKLCKAEYDFRSFISDLSVEGYTAKQKILVKGQIDLVFENQDQSQFVYTIVDYKTDQVMEKEMYLKQLSSYRQAISAMSGIDCSKIRCVLFYLRFAKAVDITAECSNEILKDKIQKVLA